VEDIEEGEGIELKVEEVEEGTMLEGVVEKVAEVEEGIMYVPSTRALEAFFSRFL